MHYIQKFTMRERQAIGDNLGDCDGLCAVVCWLGIRFSALFAVLLAVSILTSALESAARLMNRDRGEIAVLQAGDSSDKKSGPYVTFGHAGKFSMIP